MRKRKFSGSFKNILAVLLFSFACTYFVYFWVWQFKNKTKNKSYPSITIFVIQVLEISKSMSVQVFYLFGLILVYLQTSFCFLSLNSVNLFNLTGEKTWPFLFSVVLHSFIQFILLAALDPYYLFLLTEWPLLSCHGSALV